MGKVPPPPEVVTNDDLMISVRLDLKTLNVDQYFKEVHRKNLHFKG